MTLTVQTQAIGKRDLKDKANQATVEVEKKTETSTVTGSATNDNDKVIVNIGDKPAVPTTKPISSSTAKPTSSSTKKTTQPVKATGNPTKTTEKEPKINIDAAWSYKEIPKPTPVPTKEIIKSNTGLTLDLDKLKDRIDYINKPQPTPKPDLIDKLTIIISGYEITRDKITPIPTPEQITPVPTYSPVPKKTEIGGSSRRNPQILHYSWVVEHQTDNTVPPKTAQTETKSLSVSHEFAGKYKATVTPWSNWSYGHYNTVYYSDGTSNTYWVHERYGEDWNLAEESEYIYVIGVEDINKTVTLPKAQKTVRSVDRLVE